MFLFFVEKKYISEIKRLEFSSRIIQYSRNTIVVVCARTDLIIEVDKQNGGQNCAILLTSD